MTKMRRKEYEEELRRLQVELVQMQRWVVQERAKVCIVFEGRDGAGKGGTIKAITERVSPPGVSRRRTARPRANAKRPKCTCNAMSLISLRQAKS